MPNVQLSAKESVKVFVEIGTDRILGFAPEFATRPLGGYAGYKYREHILLHARDIEMWVARYRIQQERDAEQTTYRQIQRESAFRKSLRTAIQERNRHVSPVNRDLNNVLIRLMDEKYDKMMEAKAHPVIQGMAESSEFSTNAVEEFAIASPAYRNPGDTRATGSAVSEIAKIEYDKRNG